MSATQKYPTPTGSELPAALVDLFTSMRRDYAHTLDIVNDITHHHTELFTGYPSPARYLAELLRITTRKATTLITQAEQVTESVTPTGHVAPAQLPAVREALHEGTLDADHLEAITDAAAALPAWAQAANKHPAESALTQTTRAPRRRGWSTSTAGSCWPASTKTTRTHTKKTPWPNPPTNCTCALSRTGGSSSGASSTPKPVKNWSPRAGR